MSKRDFQHYLFSCWLLLDSLTSPWWPLCFPTISAAAAHSQSLCLEIMCSCPIASWCLCWARTSTLHKSSPNVIKVLTSLIVCTDTTQNILCNIRTVQPTCVCILTYLTVLFLYSNIFGLCWLHVVINLCKVEFIGHRCKVCWRAQRPLWMQYKYTIWDWLYD